MKSCKRTGRPPTHRCRQTPWMTLRYRPCPHSNPPPAKLRHPLTELPAVFHPGLVKPSCPHCCCREYPLQPLLLPLIPGGMIDRQTSSTDGTGSTDSTSTYSVRTEPVQDVPVRTTESQLHPSQSHLLAPLSLWYHVAITQKMLSKIIKNS